MEPDFITDICVIGGGPSGSVIAKQLADLHHNVLLAEKAIFPRPHVGICLSEPTDALLDFIGVGQEIEETAFFQRKHTVVKWNTDEPILKLQPGRHVDRGLFDQILLNKSRSSGVEILQGALCVSIQKRSGGGWEIDFKFKETKISVYARFLVDASGRANMLPGKTIRYAPPLFSMHANWQLQSEPSCDGWMEAGENSWLWIALLPNQQAQISLYTDPNQVVNSGKGIQSYYLKNLEKFTGLKYFRPASLIGKIKGCAASSQYNLEPVGEDFIRVGDASLSVDPMASQGVHIAISSSVQAAFVVNTILCRPEDSMTAQKFYRNSQKRRIDQFRKHTAFEYSKAATYWSGVFWQERSQGWHRATQNDNFLPMPHPSQLVQICPSTQILPTPVLQGNYIASAPALHHPGLDQPVAFLGNNSIATILQKLTNNQTVSSILTNWETNISNEVSSEIFDWLWQHKILIPSESEKTIESFQM